MTTYPRFQSHKIVQAFLIGAIHLEFVRPRIEPAAADLPPVDVDADWIAKHNPKVGGYFVRYPDGYTSYSPAQAFEEGYWPVDETVPPPAVATDAPYTFPAKVDPSLAGVISDQSVGSDQSGVSGTPGHVGVPGRRGPDDSGVAGATINDVQTSSAPTDPTPTMGSTGVPPVDPGVPPGSSPAPAEPVSTPEPISEPAPAPAADTTGGA